MSRTTPTVLVMLLLAAAPSALAQRPTGHASMATGGDPPAGGGAMMDSMTKMNQAMGSAPMTGNPDHDFVAMMIPHHQGAIDMARSELQHGTDPALRKLAQSIIAAQDQEIAVMKRWLDKHPSK